MSSVMQNNTATHPVTLHASRSLASSSMMSQINDGPLMRELVNQEKLRMRRRKHVCSNKPRSGSGRSKHMTQSWRSASERVVAVRCHLTGF